MAISFKLSPAFADGDYASLRVETYPEVKNNKTTRFVFKFDATKEGVAEKVTDFANKKFAEGKLVKVYLLEKIGGRENGTWVRTDIATADGRKSDDKTAKTSKSSKSSSKTSDDTAKILETLANINAEIAKVNDRISALELEVAKKANKRTSSKK